MALVNLELFTNLNKEQVAAERMLQDAEADAAVQSCDAYKSNETPPHHQENLQ